MLTGVRVAFMRLIWLVAIQVFRPATSTMVDPSRTDLDVRMGTCNVPVPQAFTCRTIPEWRDFLDMLRSNAAKGFPIDHELYTAADELMAKWHEKPYPPQDFYKYLCDSEATWPLHDKFCLFGFVGALIVRSRHIMTINSHDTRKSAEMDFGYATTVLGKEGSVDFLDSSPWPVSILDAYININETEFLTYDQYNVKYPVRRPAVLPESLHWRETRFKTEQVKPPIPARFHAAVIGSHATLSLEPVDMLRRFSSDIQIRAVFYGFEPRWCQILGMCDQGTSALGQLFKHAEQDPYAYSWATMKNRLAQIYDSEESLSRTELLICTEPMAGCLMLRQVAAERGKSLPILGYLGVALLNTCPPEDLDTFWLAFAEISTPTSLQGNSRPPAAILAVNNLILSEQVFYQSGHRMPYVRAHGLYTGMSYAPSKLDQVLVWRAPLFVYSTTRCSMMRFLQGMPEYRITFRFMEDDENIKYSEVAKHKAAMLIPWDHALMTFYELYSARIPLFMPATEMMYRILYQRGQLSVGERLYQSIMPGHTPPRAEFAETESGERAGPPDPHVGLSSVKAARNVAEDMLTRGLEAEDTDTAKQYMKAALDLVKDMRYFITVAENKTKSEDSYSSMGVVRRTPPRSTYQRAESESPKLSLHGLGHGTVGQKHAPTTAPWHPYTPWQMSTRDSNDYTRMRKGLWWLRRGIRFDAMRYWYQFSDFARFPGLLYFQNLPDLFCMAQSFDAQAAASAMRAYNEKSLVQSGTFWMTSLVSILAPAIP